LGSVTIYVTHDQDEALSLADRIVVLRDGEIRQVGTPEDLYSRPAHLDVADFMGFRNRISGKVRSVAGDTVVLDVGGVALNGIPREPGLVSGAVATAAIRPDDLVAVTDSTPGLPGIVEAIEYRGRDFFGQARGPGGAELFFRAERRLGVGEQVRLGAEAGKVLVFAGDAA
jgi:putative spermidine/putrescine transport system ATP-binding protein